MVWVGLLGLGSGLWSNLGLALALVLGLAISLGIRINIRILPVAPLFVRKTETASFLVGQRQTFVDGNDCNTVR